MGGRLFRQAKQIKMVAPKEFDVCVDGEMIKGNNFVVEVCPKAIKLDNKFFKKNTHSYLTQFDH